jgi:hypothetical protein
LIFEPRLLGGQLPGFLDRWLSPVFALAAEWALWGYY